MFEPLNVLIHSINLSSNVFLLPEGGLYTEVKTVFFNFIVVVSIVPSIFGESILSKLIVSLTKIITPPPRPFSLW